ncbi:MAG: F0F1 ATP synthase subunit gamma [Candidatus Nanopelagicales bacterium]
MGASLRVYRRRIKSVQSTRKITKAMEMIASSRIVKAQQRVNNALPYTTELTQALIAAVSMSADSDHPLTSQRDDHKRAAVLLLTADRGQAGAFSSNIIKEGEGLNQLLREQGTEPVHFLVGRKAVNYYRFRERVIEGDYVGFTDQPSVEDAKQIAIGLLASFLSSSTDELGTDEIFIVYTHFVNMGRQEVRVRKVLPIEVVETRAEDLPQDARARSMPLYEFEPSPEEVLDALLPRYVENLVYTALLMSSASEHAARRRAMKAATDNAEELIRDLTRKSNQARQTEITQEISEIVGGADALASASAGS